MPLDLASLLARTARVEVTFAGETFGVDYLPHVVTAELQAELAALAAEDADQVASLALLLRLLPRLIGGWEIEEDGRPLPVDEEALRRFPLGLLAAIATEITADIADPNRATTEAGAETPSSSGSSRPALSALPRTGTR